MDNAILPSATARPYLLTPFNKRGARLSPNGRWVAYATDESGPNDCKTRTELRLQVNT